jgi:hypothetical protein
MAKLYCEHCSHWERLAQPGPKPIGWCPKQKRRMESNQFCRDNFDPVYPERPIPYGGGPGAQSSYH